MPYYSSKRVSYSRAPVRKYKKKDAKTSGRSSKAPTAKLGESVALTLTRNVPVFPAMKFLRGQTYYDKSKTLAGSASSCPTYFYRANGLYDTDQTGGGHQPMGFDQMSLFYEHWTVLRAHMKATFKEGSEGARVALFLSPDDLKTDPTRIVENGLMVTKTTSRPDGSHALTTLELTCDVPRYFGRSKQAILADPQMYGTISADPGEIVYYGLAAWNPFDETSEVSVGFDVMITYDVVYWEPKKLPIS